MVSIVNAKQISENVQRIYRDIQIKVNGSQITPKDANGNVVEPFIIDGTTYLPVRAIGDALGLEVGWNGETNTVSLNNKANNTNNTIIKKDSYSVGDIYQDDSIKISYLNKNNNYKNYSQYQKPKSGYKVVSAQFEIENLGRSDIYATSSDFDCYADSYACDTFLNLAGDDSGLSFSTISTGKKAKITVYYEVPKDAKEIIHHLDILRC